MTNQPNDFFVIDYSPELFWFISSVTNSIDHCAHHVSNPQQAIEEISLRLPKIIIINGLVSPVLTNEIAKYMRNHIFLRKTSIIVFLNEITPELKRNYLLAGVSYIFPWQPTELPNREEFKNLFLHLLKTKNPKIDSDDLWLDVDYHCKAISWGRLGIVQKYGILFESNVGFNIHDQINVKNALFTSLELSSHQVTITGKNKIGRYYNYKNSFNCILQTKKLFQDQKKITEWIDLHEEQSKSKDIKVVFLETENTICVQIQSLLRTIKNYCIRGFVDITDLQEILDEQLPQIILVNREILLQSKELDILTNYNRKYKCKIITYSKYPSIIEMQMAQKNWPRFMHVNGMIAQDLVSQFVEQFDRNYKLSNNSDDKKFVFTKDSINSRIGFEIQMKIVSLSKNHLILQSNLEINENSMLECTSSLFSYLGHSTIQFVRIYSCKQFSKGIYELHAQFIGLNSGELRSINHFVNRNLHHNIASGD